MKVFEVGGAVRDRLLGLEPRDHDFVVVGSTVEEMLSHGFQQVGAAFPVFLHPMTKEEYALARREVKSGPGYRGFTVEFGPEVTLWEDLRRRDFTVNAMARDPESGGLYDPFGGEKDLADGYLRAVDPKAFQEDPLRVLRLARFATRFMLQPDTMTMAAARAAVPELPTLSQERVTEELTKALLQAQPGAASLVLRLLEELGALPLVLPEVAALRGVPQPAAHHPEGDALEHTLLVLDALRHRTAEKVWAALFHDCGKAHTDREKWPPHHDHETLGEPVVAEAVKRMRLPLRVQQFVTRVTRWHMKAHKWDQMRPGSLYDWFMALGVRHFPHRLDDFLDVFDADWGTRSDMGQARRDYMKKALAAVRAVQVGPYAGGADAGKWLSEKHRDLACMALAEVKKMELRHDA